MKIDAIVFDKDGTLFDFARTWGSFGRSILLRLTQNDGARAAQLGQVIGFDFDTQCYAQDSIVIAATAAEVADTLAPHVADIPRDALIELINAEAALAPQSPAVALVPFLEELRTAGIKLGVATNDSEHPALQHLESA
ncbi:MAG: HAD family hydrolase, partial [Pseudomonadota bacterium]